MKLQNVELNLKINGREIIMNNVRVITNPVVLLNLCTMRDKNTDSQGVRIATRKITRCLLYEAAKNLPLLPKRHGRLY